MAERSVLRERYCKPKSNWSARNSRMLPKDAESGSVFLPKHQRHHLDQAELYAAWVLVLQDWRSSSVTLLENPCEEKSCLRQAMRLETTDSLESKGEDSSPELTGDPAPWEGGLGSSLTSSAPEDTTLELAMPELPDKHNLPLLAESS